MPQRRQLDHVGNFNFRVEIGGVGSGAFKGVDGLTSQIEVIEFQDGTDLILRKRPGRAKYGDIVLKKGYISTDELWHWKQFRTANPAARKELTIHQVDGKGRPTGGRWSLYECWPKSWKVQPRADGGLAIEEITIAHESVAWSPV